MTQQASRTAMVMGVRTRFTAAQINAGATLVAAVKGMKHRLVDFLMIAVGGAATTATSVDIIGTQSAAEARLAVVAVAGLTQSAAVAPDNANTTLLADGASFAACDENTAITVGKQSGGSALDGATHIDVIATYASEEA